MDGISHVPRTVDQIFSDFRGRRAGLIKALTTEVGKFYQQCDPEKVNFCLYGLPNETWEVNLPVEMVPPDLPEPTLGINFARDGMQEEDWLSLVALHSDSWLHSVAIYFGAGVGLCKSERTMLFQMINDLPTVFEVVTGTVRQSKDQSAAQNNSSKSKSGGNMTKGLKFFPLYKKEDASEGEEAKAEQGATLSGDCGEFLICCDTCKRWFLAKLITPAQAEYFKQYKSLGFNYKEAMWNCWKSLPLIFIALAILIFVFQCGRSI